MNERRDAQLLVLISREYYIRKKSKYNIIIF